MLAHVYSELGVPGFAESEQRFQRYVDAQKRFKTNEHVDDEEMKQKVIKRWQEAFELFGYAA